MFRAADAGGGRLLGVLPVSLPRAAPRQRESAEWTRDLARVDAALLRGSTLTHDKAGVGHVCGLDKATFDQTAGTIPRALGPQGCFGTRAHDAEPRDALVA